MLSRLLSALLWVGSCQQPSGPILLVHFDRAFAGSVRCAQEASTMARAFDEVIVLTKGDGPWEGSTTLVAVSPTKVVPSGSGEHELAVSGPRATVAGGYFRACFSNAVRLLLRNTDHPITLVVPTKAVYFGDARTLYEQFVDNFRGDREGFEDYVRGVAVQQWGLEPGRFTVALEGSVLTIAER